MLSKKQPRQLFGFNSNMRWAYHQSHLDEPIYLFKNINLRLGILILVTFYLVLFVLHFQACYKLLNIKLAHFFNLRDGQEKKIKIDPCCHGEHYIDKLINLIFVMEKKKRSSCCQKKYERLQSNNVKRTTRERIIKDTKPCGEKDERKFSWQGKSGKIVKNTLLI